MIGEVAWLVGRGGRGGEGGDGTEIPLTDDAHRVREGGHRGPAVRLT